MLDPQVFEGGDSAGQGVKGSGKGSYDNIKACQALFTSGSMQADLDVGGSGGLSWLASIHRYFCALLLLGGVGPFY